MTSRANTRATEPVPAGRQIGHSEIRNGAERLHETYVRIKNDLGDALRGKSPTDGWQDGSRAWNFRGYSPDASADKLLVENSYHQLESILWWCYQVAAEDIAGNRGDKAGEAYIAETTHTVEISPGISASVLWGDQPDTDGREALRNLQGAGLVGWSTTDYEAIISELKALP